MMYPREHRLEYLKSATGIEDFSDMDVLDWGGNHGNLIRDGLRCKSYTCADIDNQGIHMGKQDFPEHTWIHFNKFHPVYSNSIAEVDIDLTDDAYDLIFAYSVFTHDTVEEMVAELTMLKQKLRSNGVLCASYIDPATAKIFVIKREAEYQQSINRNTFNSLTDYAYFIDNLTVTTEYDRSQKCNHFLSVYNTGWLLEKLSQILGKCEIYSPDRFEITDYHTQPFQPSFIWRKS